MSKLPSSDDYTACQTRLDELLFCDCCEAHGVNKPTDYKPWIMKDRNESVDRKGESLGCSCTCRHEAREICRNHPTLVAAEALVTLSQGS